jgi:hypothetical protein
VTNLSKKYATLLASVDNELLLPPMELGILQTAQCHSRRLAITHWCGVWLRPDSRRHGILSHYWPIFERAHGNFRVLTPLSESMKSFLCRHVGHDLTEAT